MSTQSTLTTFYSARKRSSIEEIKKHAKVRIIDGYNSDERKLERTEEQGTVLLLHKTREVVVSKVSQGVSVDVQKSDGSQSFIASVKSAKKSRIKLDVPKGKGKTIKTVGKSRQKSLKDVFASLEVRNKESYLAERAVENQRSENSTQEHPEADLPKNHTVEAEQNNDNKNEMQSQSPRKRNVTFEKKGTLSPAKVNDSKRRLFEAAIGREIDADSAKGSNSESHEKNNQTSAGSGSFTKMSRKELSLGEIRGRIIRSPRLNELRESIARISSCAAKIREADREKDSGAGPSLHKFQSIEFEVPVVCSPKKMLASPCKSPPASPLPAYQRYAHLTSPQRMPISPSKAPFVSPSKSSPLALPYQYRCLAEVFRCVDVVSAMMMNRKELITFSKLRLAVQEMMRRPMIDRNLGQIKKVFPEAFEFYYAKVNQLTVSSAKAERYELVIRPLLKTKEDEEVSDKSSGNSTRSDGKVNSMTPSVLLDRRHAFHRNLLEMVKDHHEEFLRSLDPPMVVPREKLTRWHPAFEVELLPEVDPAEMPQAPDAPEKCSSAKDVLSKARNLFGCNTRMERALQRVGMGDSKKSEAKGDDGSNPSTSTASDEPAPPANPALKGIPLALLQKVRERQAAKAMMTMTMSPADEKKAERLSHLPELARILRGIFVSERKGVLPLEHVIKKLSDSYRGNLRPSELEDHVKLLETSVPGWISIFAIRLCHYVKLAKDADLSRVISKLEKLASNARG